MHTLVGSNYYVNAVSFSPDGTKAVAVLWNNIVRLWDVLKGTLLLSLLGHTDWVLRGRVQS